ncbi:putative Pre-mRNA-splicing factor srp1 [Glarea lozoyensis 74030]|uniref:Putative Pre-mRNA-splicing factor srp1 n=1 Tax=Glarea lozoyensis (strain ATCC 74030 / MF5533) TaxID=1104152 RepID=H0EM93_GLAL7|nr:putative Pre-mRNA-splicing factor srp1 [Glarea lozoyensis 74030]
MAGLFVATYLRHEPQRAVCEYTRILLFAFVEYESRRDADDAYHEMHNKRIGHDDLLKIEWARTPPSASWRFDSGQERERAPARRRSPRRGGRSPSPRRSRGDYSPRKESRRDRDRDYDRRDRGDRDRSRSPDDRDREAKDERDEGRDRDRERDNGTNGDERKGKTVLLMARFVANVFIRPVA